MTIFACCASSLLPLANSRAISATSCAILDGDAIFHEESVLPLPTVTVGEESRIKIVNQENAMVSGINWKLYWKQGGAYDKYGRSAILVKNAGDVVIENLSIDMMDSDYRASHGILVEKCNKLIIRNVRIRGAINQYAIRAEDCNEVEISNVEIAGLAYDEYQSRKRAGGGIQIRYGYLSSSSPPENRRIRINSCYIHDYFESDIRRNHDGIDIESPLDVEISDCLFENWASDGKQYAADDRRPDAAVDLSFRRDSDPIGRMVVKNNVFKNALFVKTPGTKASSEIIFENNLFIGTGAAFYHNNAVVFRANTFLTDGSEDSITFRLWEVKADATVELKQNIFAGNAPRAMFYANDQGDPSKVEMVEASGNYYAFFNPADGDLFKTLWVDQKTRDDMNYAQWTAYNFVKDSTRSHLALTGRLGNDIAVNQTAAEGAALAASLESKPRECLINEFSKIVPDQLTRDACKKLQNPEALCRGAAGGLQTIKSPAN